METALFSFLTFLLGLLLGHWLAVGRDKRKEFNEAAGPIRGWILKAKDAPDPYTRWPSGQEVDRFVQCLRPWQRKAFLRFLSTYKTLHDELQVSDSFGQVRYRDDKEIGRVLNELFRYTKPR
jgi:hypothetical protein